MENGTVQIGYKKYRVLLKKNPSAEIKGKKVESYGTIEFGPQLIEIDSESTGVNQVRTLLHEIIHGIDDLLDIQLNEHKTDLLAVGFTMVLKDNPTLIKKLTDDLLDDANQIQTTKSSEQ